MLSASSGQQEAAARCDAPYAREQDGGHEGGVRRSGRAASVLVPGAEERRMSGSKAKQSKQQNQYTPVIPASRNVTPMSTSAPVSALGGEAEKEVDASTP